MKSIFEAFPVSNEEYAELDQEFGKLAYTIAWQLLKKNTKNNHTDDLEDIVQELRLSIVRAASYYKRQVYVEECFDVASKYIVDPATLLVLDQLKVLWGNRTKHGANRVVFGPPQEEVLETIMNSYIPEHIRPNRNAELQIHKVYVINGKQTSFAAYCKAITWNSQKTMGKKITKEKAIRFGLASLSEHDHLSFHS